ncbi:MAG: OmpA family protein [Bacteroidetes bacterium]|nr:OmpA family protein [Bacteroidota bacterium]
MKKIFTATFFLFLLIGTIAFPTNNEAQLRDYSYKIGVQGNYLMPANEFTPDGVSMMFRPFIRYQLTDALHLGAGVGYGWVQGKDYGDNDYKTSIIPVDLKLLVAPFNFSSWNPYIYAGAGVLYWNLETAPLNPPLSAGFKNGELEFIGEIGIGTEIALSSNWVLDLSYGFNVIDEDRTNGLATNLNNDFLHEYDRYYNIGLGIAYAAESCESDKDNDGLGRCEEEEIGTDPRNADTDGDGLKDGEEVKKYSTDPLKADSDGDGLTDYEEVKTYSTNPNKADTDADGLNDFDEVKKYKTDPNKADTDGDGLFDGVEVNTHKTDPNKADTDGDGLNDGEEVTKYKTDPTVADTDKGSVNDGVEVKRGTDPLNPADDVKVEKPVVMEMPKFDPVLFAFNKSLIQKSEVDKLVKVFEFLDKNKDVDLEVKGHTDNRGESQYNQKLSVDRAEAAKAWLVKKGIDASRIKTTGFGFTQPAASNDTVEGRKQNRRAELEVQGVK